MPTTISKWKIWLHGLAAATIGGSASGVAVVIVDPATFSDWHKLATVMLISGLFNAAAYLKQSPLPPCE